MRPSTRHVGTTIVALLLVGCGEIHLHPGGGAASEMEPDAPQRDDPEPDEPTDRDELIDACGAHQVIVSGGEANDTGRLVVGDRFVFWDEQYTYQPGKLRRVRKDGGDVVDLITGCSGSCTRALVQLGSDLVFSDASGIHRIPFEGGSPTLLHETEGLTTAMATDGRWIYFDDEGQLARLDLDGSFEVLEPRRPLALTLNDEHVYFATRASNVPTLERSEKSGKSHGHLAALTPSANDPWGVAVVADSVTVLFRDGDHAVMSVADTQPSGNGTEAPGVVRIIAGTGHSLLADETDLYWVRDEMVSPTSTIRRATAGGGEPVDVFTTLEGTHILHLTQRGDCLYWTSSDGAVHAQRK